MPLRIDIWSDYASAWCFLMFTSLQKLAKTHDVNLHWRAYEINPAGMPSLTPKERQEIEEIMRPHFEVVAREKYGVAINPGPPEVNTHLALIGAKYAEDHAKRPELYHEAVFKGYWQYGVDIGQPEILQQIADSLSIEGLDFASISRESIYNTKVKHDLLLARQFNIEEVPTMIINNKFAFSGSQTYDMLVGIVKQFEDGQ